MPREHSYNNGRIKRAGGGESKNAAPKQNVKEEAAVPKPQTQQKSGRPSAAYNPAEKRAKQAAAPPKPKAQQPQSLFEEEIITINRRVPAQTRPPQEKAEADFDVFSLMGEERPKQREKAEIMKAEPEAPQRASAKQPQKSKKKNWKKGAMAAAVVLVVLGTAALLAINYLGKVFDPGNLGILDKIPIVGKDGVPKAYSKKDYLHILIVGIDNEEGRDYGAGLGLTDMLLYCRFDLKNNKLNMMQIPRDSYIGESYPTGGTGKINALLIQGDNKKNPIVNLTTPFQQQFKLPLDYYIAMDMDAMKAIVNTFGAIRVYVPREMSHAGSYLPAGWQWLDGDASEFFVRNRYGPGFERGDIDRLDNQRHFYSALFRRFLNLTPRDIPGLLSVFHHYCNTDIPLNDLYSIAVSGLALTAEDVMFCKAPGATGDGLDPTGKNRNNYYLDLYGRGTEEEPGLANLLNWYFRPEGDGIPAEELLLPQIQIPQSIPLYPPNVQVMSNVQEGEGGEDVDVEPVA